MGKIPIVSVIMATYNRCEIVSESVRSILDQSLTNFELIIIDDCSTDNTRSILQEIASKDDRIRLTNTHENSGCNIARNVGIDLAIGHYMAIMDDDDIAVHKRLEIQVEYLEKHKKIGLVGSAVHPISKRGIIASPYPDSSVINGFPGKPGKVFEDIYLGKYVIPNPALMFRSTVLKKCKYPPVKYNGADVTLTLQLAALGVRMGIILKPLVMMRQGREHVQMTSKISRVHLGRRRRVRDISKWLEIHDIHEFDHLYESALLNTEIKHYIETFVRGKTVRSFFNYLKALKLNPRYTLLITRSIILRRFSTKR